MSPRLSGQNYNFFKVLLALDSQKILGYKENNAKCRPLSRKPRIDWRRKDREVFKPITKRGTNGNYFRYSNDKRSPDLYSVCHENETNKEF